MKRILVSPIGNRDPYSSDGKEGSALTLCRHIQPDIVYLLPTAERPDVKNSTFPNALETKEKINGVIPNAEVYIKPLDVSDPTDFAQILPQVKDVLSRILKETELFSDRKIFLNASSATSQIQIACLLAVSSGFFPAKALQVAAPEYVPEEQRVREENFP